MLRFKKNEYFMIDEKKLNKDEAIMFIQLLKYEKQRHIRAKRECINRFCGDMNLGKQLNNKDERVYSLFWYSSYKRHIQDIKMIDKSINYLENKFDLNNKNNLVNWM